MAGYNVDPLNGALSRGTVDNIRVSSMWVGDVTTTEATVSARFSAGSSVRLGVSRSPDLAQAVFSDAVNISSNFAKMSVSGLSAGKQYYYALEVDGKTDPVYRGRFQTPAVGPQSFKFIFGSCIKGSLSRSIYNIMAAEDPLFFFCVGDFNYTDSTSTSQAPYIAGLDNRMANAKMGPILRNMSSLWMWDDHDYQNDNSNGTSAGRNTSLAVYRDRAPHPPLAFATATDPICFTKQVGRVLFVATDLRSTRSANSDTDNSSKTMMGAAQKQWFKDTLAANTDKFIIWVCSMPWIASTSAGGDDWGGYNTERVELANYMKSLGLEGKICIISGDAHMVAIDNGANADYATGGGMNIPVFHAAAIEHDSGSLKGGPYSEGYVTGAGHIGIVDITDDGDEITVDWSAKRDSDGTVIKSLSFTVNL
jgi:phosphodiesterase/alkaline phosphatase D-like protein